MPHRPEQALTILIWPLLVIGVACGAATHMNALPVADVAVLAWAPPAVLAVAAALAWRFHSSRGFLISLWLGVILLARLHPPPEPVAAVLPFCLAVVVPLNLLVMAFVKERGLATLPGLWRLLAVAVQALALSHESQFPNDAVVRWATTGAHWLATPPGVAAGVVMGVLLVRLVMAPGPMEAAAVGVLGTMVLAMTAVSVPVTQVYVLAGALLTATALVQHSYSMAFLDELTGIPARRALRQELAGLSGRYAIAMVDIDHFKGFNDTYGHDVGDQCLRLVASRLSKVSGGGRAFRYGGEEFTVLFPGKSAKESLDSLEMLRQNIETHPMILRSPDRPKRKPKDPVRERSAERVTVTVSIGVAEKNERLDHPEAVIKAADKALYKAKKKGRNQVCR